MYTVPLGLIVSTAFVMVALGPFKPPLYVAFKPSQLSFPDALT
ncbi:hypothetical protein [Methanobacterium sp.]